MRIERVQASAHKKGRVLVFLEDGACLKITEQEALDFGLRTGDDLDGRRLEQLKKAASVSNVKATAGGPHRQAGHEPPRPGAEAPGEGGQSGGGAVRR